LRGYEGSSAPEGQEISGKELSAFSLSWFWKLGYFSRDGGLRFLCHLTPGSVLSYCPGASPHGSPSRIREERRPLRLSPVIILIHKSGRAKMGFLLHEGVLSPTEKGELSDPSGRLRWRRVLGAIYRFSDRSSAKSLFPGATERWQSVDFQGSFYRSRLVCTFSVRTV
jgi:hypothetical protein